MNDAQFRERAVTILHNLARERPGFWASLLGRRWPISHEPLRNDAANLLREAGESRLLPVGQHLVGDQKP